MASNYSNEKAWFMVENWSHLHLRSCVHLSVNLAYAIQRNLFYDAERFPVIILSLNAYCQEKIKFNMLLYSCIIYNCM